MGVRHFFCHLWNALRRTGGRSRLAKTKKIDRHYVSEFGVFMDRYLEEHPEVLADQARGRAMYWDRKLDLEALEKAAEDSVPVERYSYFSPLAGRPENREQGKEEPKGRATGSA